MIAGGWSSSPELVQVSVMFPLQAHDREQLISTGVLPFTSTSGPGVTVIRRGSETTEYQHVEILSQKCNSIYQGDA